MSTLNEQIRAAMAKAFFASAWADLQDEKDADDDTRVNLSGREIMDVMPDEIDAGAIHAASTLTMDLERANKSIALDIESLYRHAQCAQVIFNETGDRDLTPENFGHYLAMQAMGHGVGLSDAFGDAVSDAIIVPHVEFGSHSLQNDY
jgi:hypothetical protein